MEKENLDTDENNSFTGNDITPNILDASSLAEINTSNNDNWEFEEDKISSTKDSEQSKIDKEINNSKQDSLISDNKSNSIESASLDVFKSNALSEEDISMSDTINLLNKNNDETISNESLSNFDINIEDNFNQDKTNKDTSKVHIENNNDQKVTITNRSPSDSSMNNENINDYSEIDIKNEVDMVNTSINQQTDLPDNNSLDEFSKERMLETITSNDISIEQAKNLKNETVINTQINVADHHNLNTNEELINSNEKTQINELDQTDQNNSENSEALDKINEDDKSSDLVDDSISFDSQALESITDEIDIGDIDEILEDESLVLLDEKMDEIDASKENSQNVNLNINEDLDIKEETIQIGLDKVDDYLLKKNSLNNDLIDDIEEPILNEINFEDEKANSKIKNTHNDLQETVTLSDSEMFKLLEDVNETDIIDIENTNEFDLVYSPSKKGELLLPENIDHLSSSPTPINTVSTNIEKKELLTVENEKIYLSDIKESELIGIFRHLDTLFQHLPQDKMQDFANSHHYDVYISIINRLKENNITK